MITLILSGCYESPNAAGGFPGAILLRRKRVAPDEPGQRGSVGQAVTEREQRFIAVVRQVRLLFQHRLHGGRQFEG